MEAIQLSERLRRVAAFIRQGAVLADIGSDHAYLPCFACQTGLAAKAVAGEVNEGPYRSAITKVQSLCLEKAVQVRMGNGLEVIDKADAVDTIVVAGMGGGLIRTILDEGTSKLSDNMTLILQPNVGSDTLRRWLDSHSWDVSDEDILEEDGHIYEIIVARYNQQHRGLNGRELLMGPKLLQSRGDVFKKKWLSEAHKVKQILMSLDQTNQSPDIMAKRCHFEAKLKMIEGEINE
ncbi:tRNA (adenine(22)-N(1))-methyltransferase [Scopulibacillus darangshiensis]|uniref:tRNA (adenine(22)-N(1))-methyltransferase n=1 Tax=Scopulibacillus darangshiensis TaxID=442528 RepID=UPI00104E2A25|nr:tRNA (adenine(22)-N(1))-methyltransferase TrmK [Scopulibacillus darangshiensis]